MAIGLVEACRAGLAVCGSIGALDTLGCAHHAHAILQEVSVLAFKAERETGTDLATG